ncbi:FecR family protein [Prosthecobacter debontii]|uniref:FecR family protein n=1 Tax=Prosthecobacter debontii TaxID=48467 RepID=A0A1T4WLM1_9BACT|nr:LamG-like jellyroll fold domain-containing protein [Prosthecobacter debontii]SKA78224.1 FecR family protein [Prosthecobacter debontii]
MNAETRQELEGLLTALLEEEMSAEQKARLDDLLRSDWDCRRFYLEHMDQHARLLTAPAVSSGRLQQPTSVLSAPTRPKRRWVPLSAAAAILGLAGLSFFAGGQLQPQAQLATSPPEQTEQGCALITQTLNATFAEDSTAPIQGSMLLPGQLHLKSGLVKIEFFSGATLLAEGEVRMDIHSAWEAACHSGQVRVRVPPPARGFRLHAPGLNLVDLGTEFGVRVDTSGAAEVHVFEGEVEAHPGDAEMRLLTGGQSLRRDSGQTLTAGTADAEHFTSIERMNEISTRHAQERFEAWWNHSLELRKDPRLIACYLFKHWEADKWDRLVNNFTEPRVPTRAGGAVGARWVEGRWPMKNALEFKGPGDRVRINLGPETYPAITLATWVRVDGVDRKYNALLLTDGYEPGEPHWQIYEDGSLMFSIAYPRPKDPNKKYNQIYYSPRIFDLANQRRWHHLAVTYDSHSGEAVQYLDGREISREVNAHHVPDRPITFGASEIGNWGLPTENHQFPIRNLNGRMDEFLIYQAALAPAEIRSLYEAGKPD